MSKRFIFWIIILILSLYIFYLALNATVNLISTEMKAFDFDGITSFFINFISKFSK